MVEPKEMGRLWKALSLGKSSRGNSKPTEEEVRIVLAWFERVKFVAGLMASGVDLAKGRIITPENINKPEMADYCLAVTYGMVMSGKVWLDISDSGDVVVIAVPKLKIS